MFICIYVLTFTDRHYLQNFVYYILNTWVFILTIIHIFVFFKPGENIREGKIFVWDSELILAYAYGCLLLSRRCT